MVRNIVNIVCFHFSTGHSDQLLVQKKSQSSTNDKLSIRTIDY